MLNVLLESKAQHPRRVGGTLASTLVHGAIIAGAVLLTVQEGPHVISGKPQVEDIGPYVDIKPAKPPVTERPPASPQTSDRSPAPTIPMPTIETAPTTIAPVDPAVGPIAPDNLRMAPEPLTTTF